MIGRVPGIQLFERCQSMIAMPESLRGMQKFSSVCLTGSVELTAVREILFPEPMPPKI